VRQPLHAALFDMDGLLVDTEPLWFETERMVMARLGGRWAPEDQYQLLGGSLKRTVSYMLGRAAADGAGHSGGAAGQPGTQLPGPEVVGEWLLTTMTELMLSRGVTVLPGAPDLLAEVAAAGLPRALVTSSQRRIMDTVLAVTGLKFPVTVCGEDVARTKPDPEPYLRAATLLGVDPAHCAALEDSPSGVTAAQAAGCAVIMVPSLPGTLPPGAADRPGWLVAGSLREVSLAGLQAAVAAHLAAGAPAAVCDDEEECRQG
jgi:HAD superfamily hydrolase (TIGR01509 family)